MHSLTGFWQLVRLNIRLDIVKLPIVISLVSILFFFTITSITDLYGTDYEQQIQYAATTAPSVVGRVFAGPIDGPELGAIVLNEGYLFTAVAIAFMSTLTVIRHTRQNEETGRSELVGSTVTSKHAPLAAALFVAFLANIIFGAITALLLVVNDLDTLGSVLTGLAFTATGLAFACLAGVAAQLTDSARGANAYCALIIGVSFILRAIGDSTGQLVNNGLGVQSTFPSWMSPFGWGQQLYPYTQQNLWVFLLFAGLIVGTLALAIFFMVKRDIGMGIFATKDGRARAATSLLSVFGLARKMQKGIFRGWAIAIIVLGITYGYVINEFQGFLEENDEFREAFAQFGGNINDAFLGVLISFMAITITGYAVQAMLRMRSEESNGRLESLLSTNLDRKKWLLSHVSYIWLGVLALTLLTGLSMGLTYVLSTGAAWSELWSILAATFTQSVAVFAFTGFVMLVFSIFPNLSVPLSWGSFAGCLVILQLGVILELPQWVLNASPFAHLPTMPAESFSLAPFLSLIAATLILMGSGFMLFRKRDIVVT